MIRPAQIERLARSREKVYFFAFAAMLVGYGIGCLPVDVQGFILLGSACCYATYQLVRAARGE